MELHNRMVVALGMSHGELVRWGSSVTVASIALGFVNRAICGCGSRESTHGSGVGSSIGRQLRVEPASGGTATTKDMTDDLIVEENGMILPHPSPVEEPTDSPTVPVMSALQEGSWNEWFDIFQFDFYLLAASVYISVLFTDWQSYAALADGLDVSQRLLSFWVQVAASWLTLALYAWTLAAPYLFHNRDFS
eukprot:GHVQ01010705.1.p2 GENE.GHVQ01010705.1~~GHVQ01010705.1.p2  ORF type:complete len:192 (+),score=25.87 GHVQ01010705.1:1952-2527(+)